MPKEGAEPLKYLCVDKEVRAKIHSLKTENNQEIFEHIKDLYDLINYQIVMINDQRREIISMQHDKAWKHYDEINMKDIPDRKHFRC